MRIFQAVLPLLHADRLLMALVLATLQMASLAPGEAQLLSHRHRQACLRDLLRSRADTRTLQTSIRPTSALPQGALLAVLLRRKASRQSRLLVFQCLLQELQGRLQCLLDSCHLLDSSLRQALAADEMRRAKYPFLIHLLNK